jgi:hypothetical protein
MLSFSMEISSVAEPAARGPVIKLPPGAVITDYGSGFLTFYQILQKMSSFL